MRHVEPARSDSFPSGQRYSPAPPGEQNVFISGREIPPHLYNLNNPGTKTVITRVDTAPRGVETPPHELIADWLGIVHRASAPRGG